mmetsp:Transcript_38005/g.94447  ORF Transcript_38005/g.94447 Transcript_38005/m.94447 type:complete len:374 (+) Transcript_38005:2479-3600(+)
MLQSIRIRSYGSLEECAACHISTPSSPSIAISTVCPAFSSMARTTSMLNSLSSTTSIFPSTLPPAANAVVMRCSATSRWNSSTSAVAARPASIVKKNLVPLPYSDSTWICPRIISTSCLQIASPSPTPIELSTLLSRIFEKRPKRACMFSSRMPMPVSSTAKCRRRWLANCCCTRARTVIEPCGVNLTALNSKLSSTCRSRCWSPTTNSGSSAARSASMRTFLLSAFTFTISTAARTTSRRLNTFCSSSSFPASILEMSRMSFTRFIRCCADIIAFCTYCSVFPLTSFSPSSASCSMPSTPFRGVRISCDIDAMNLPFASDAARAFAAAICAFSMSFFSVMSCPTITTPTTSPRAECRVVAFRSSSTRCPPRE